MQSAGTTGRWGLFIRLAVTATCLAVLAYAIDGQQLWAMMMRLSSAALLAVLTLHLGIILLLAWRWKTIVRACGQCAKYDVALRLTVSATFLNMILPFSVGGDICRVWFGRNVGIGLMSGTTIAILDRIIGLISLGILLAVLAVCLPTADLPSELKMIMILTLPMILIGLGALILLYHLGAKQMLRFRDISASITTFMHHHAAMGVTLLTSLAAHVMAVLIFFVSAHGLGIGFSLIDALLFGPVILLATMLPISLGGWGLREAAAIVVLPVAGVTAEQALAMALMFGLTQLMVSGAGSIFCIGWSGFRFGGSRL